jgi:type VI secretion system protein ImpH
MAPVLVCQLEGAWRNIDRTEQTVLGKHGRNAVLGNGAVLGSKVWDQQGSIEIELGPLSFARFQHFLPGAPGYAAIVELSRFYVGVELEIRFRLVLAASEIPSLNLGTARLGYTSWLKTRPARSDDSQVAFCAGHD